MIERPHEPETPLFGKVTPNVPEPKEHGWAATWECPNANCMAANSVAWASTPNQVFCQYCQAPCPAKHLREVGPKPTKETACSSSPSRSRSSAQPSSGPSGAPATSSGGSGPSSPTRSTTTTRSSSSSAMSDGVGYVAVSDQRARELNLIVGKCKKCSARILFGVTDKGAEQPLQDRALQVYIIDKGPDGKPTGRVSHRAAFESHFADCPHAQHFKKGKKS